MRAPRGVRGSPVALLLKEFSLELLTANAGRVLTRRVDRPIWGPNYWRHQDADVHQRLRSKLEPDSARLTRM
jgi:DNA-binding response OmpR family regulator